MSALTIPGHREASQTCRALIKSFEKCRLVGYLPTPHDVPTIGWGATGRGIFVGLVWTQSIADARFESDINVFGAGVDHLLGKATTTQGMFDALVSFAYNDGLAALHGSHLLSYHIATNYSAAANEFPKWDHQGAAVLQGLLNRRLQEQSMYRS